MNKVLMIFIAASALSGCSKNPPPAEATACFTVQIDRSSLTDARAVIEEFSRRNKLSRNETYDFMQVWEARDSLGWRAEIIFDFTEGSDSMLALFVYDQELSGLTRDFNTLVETSIASRWAVAPCNKVTGLSIPRISRPSR